MIDLIATFFFGLFAVGLIAALWFVSTGNKKKDPIVEDPTVKENPEDPIEDYGDDDDCEDVAFWDGWLEDWDDEYDDWEDEYDY